MVRAKGQRHYEYALEQEVAQLRALWARLRVNVQRYDSAAGNAAYAHVLRMMSLYERAEPSLTASRPAHEAEGAAAGK